MKKFILAVLAAMSLSLLAEAQTKVELTVGESDGTIIPKEIYGQFAEHLGSCIYGGLWVGPESEIPNIDGYRTDVLLALRALKVPVMRWPGGCFADEYHWRDGIGPREDRPRMVNSNWGGTVEDNSFGTHEFLNLCELLDCEPYISGNVGSGTVEELAKWVEYMTAPDGPMAALRAKNGRQEPWKVKYLGVGNESWGCGGCMTPLYYSFLYRRYQTYCRNFGGNQLYKVASGASDYDYNWTTVLMENVGTMMHGLSLHYYTVDNWNEKGSATQFTTEQYYNTLGKAVEVETVLKKHMAIMDKYDPEGRVDLLLDEWGTWFDQEPGSIPGHLYQQNTMRDAMVAALSLNIFHRYTKRLKMTNIAQIANVLQAMVLTRGSEMVLTPTYHVFRMYNVHQDALYLPVGLSVAGTGIAAQGATAAGIAAPGAAAAGNAAPGATAADGILMGADSKGRPFPLIDATASQDAEGRIHISLVNASLDEAAEVTLQLSSKPKISGEILTADEIAAYNDFGAPSIVTPAGFTSWKCKGNRLTVTLPAKSIVTLEID